MEQDTCLDAFTQGCIPIHICHTLKQTGIERGEGRERRGLSTDMHRECVKWMHRSGSLPSKTRRDIRQRDFFSPVFRKLILMIPWPWTCSSSKIFIFLHLSALYYLETAHSIWAQSMLLPIGHVLCLAPSIGCFCFQSYVFIIFWGSRSPISSKGFPLFSSVSWKKPLLRPLPHGITFLSLFSGMSFDLDWEGIHGGMFLFVFFSLCCQGQGGGL